MLTVVNLAGAAIIPAAGGPLVPTTIFAITSTQLGSIVRSAGYGGNTAVTKFVSTAPAASQLKLTIVANNSDTVVLANVYIGNLATSGNAWAMAGNQVEALFSGASGVTLGPGNLVSSDWVTFTPATGSNAQNFVVAYNVTSGRLGNMSIAGTASYFHTSSQTASNPGAGFTAVAGTILTSVHTLETQ